MRGCQGSDNRNRALLLVALAQLAIGAAAVFARFALASSGPLAVSAARLCIGALPLLLLAAVRGRLRVQDARAERRLLFAGALLAVHFAAWIASLDFASVAISTLLVCTTPVWTEAYAVARRRRIDAFAAASIVAALAGVAIVVGAPDRANTPPGIALALTGAVAIAAYLVVVRSIDRRYDTLAVTSRTYSYAAVLLAASAALVHDHLPPAGDVRAWGGILAMALLSQLFGHTALNAAVRVISATLVSTLTLLEPVIAAVLAAWAFGERLGAATAFGAAVILVAIGVALRGEARATPDFGIDTDGAGLQRSMQPLPERDDRVNDRRGHERTPMVATTPHWLDGHLSLDGPVEVTPPHWVDDGELVALEDAHHPFSFERFGDGTLLVSPPAGGIGSMRSGGLFAQVFTWAKSGGGGAVFDCSGGFTFPDRAMLAADATYVTAERWNALSDAARASFAPIVPDACFEMMSQSDRLRTTLRKVRTYLRYGVRLVVLIDPKRRRIYVGREGEQEPRDLGEVAHVDCAPVMPGFVLDVASLLAVR